MSTAPEEKVLTYRQALNEALHEEMDRDTRVIVMGEDVAAAGGVYKVTTGLLEAYGPERVLDTPISEAGIAGLALGAAMTGLRPVVEIMFDDFLFLAADQLLNQAAKVRYMSGGKLGAPMVVRTTLGAGRRAAAQHSQSVHAMFAHIPGVKVVLPSDPADAKGLLKSAIRDPDPVIFFEDKLSYGNSGPVPTTETLIPIGRAAVKRHGSDITLVASSRAVGDAMSSAQELASEGIEAEVVDLRTLTPLDGELVLSSVRKTGRCVVIDQGHRRFGAAAEIVALIMEEAFDCLKAGVSRVTALDVPAPYSPPLEDLTMPGQARIVKAARALFRRTEE
jgi:acetoin:2,6-dichlorophenolindophenol oxidoreductase subunit beta